MIRSAIFRIRSWWEMMMIEPCVFSCMFSNTRIRLLKLHRSMPASGSSKIDSFVPRAMIIAISMRFSSPPDSDAFTSRFT